MTNGTDTAFRTRLNTLNKNKRIYKHSFTVPGRKRTKQKTEHSFDGRTTQDLCCVFPEEVSDWHDTKLTGVTVGGTNTPSPVRRTKIIKTWNTTDVTWSSHSR